MAEASGFSAIRRALSGPSYRNYAAGGFVSSIGTWVQRVAVFWLTWELTKSATWLGIMAFADIAPAVAFLPLTGAVADRTNRLATLRLTQSLLLAQAAVLAALIFADLITIELLLGLTLFQGAATAFNQPVRLALVPSLVAREDVPAAIAINALVFNVARLIGPAVAGGVIVWLGIAYAFASNAVTFLFFVVMLSFVRVVRPDEVAPRRPLRNIPTEIIDGYRYAASHFGIGSMLVATLLIGICLRPYIDLLAGFSAEVFGRGADGLAMMTSSIGCGAVFAGVWLSQRGRLSGLATIWAVATALFAVVLVVFCATPSFWLGLVCLVFAGFFMSVNGISQQTLIQSAVDGQMRGRVLGLYGLLMRAGPGIGALIMGSISSHLGLRWTVIGGAALGLAFCAWAWRRRPRLAAALEGG